MINQINNMTNIINIGNVNIIFVFVKFVFVVATLVMIYKFFKWLINRMKFDKKFIIELHTDFKQLKGNSISVGITNIGSEKLWIDKVCILLSNDYWFEITCNKCLDLQQKEFFEERYSECNNSVFNDIKQCFIFYNEKIYMIEFGKNDEKHKLIKKQKYISYINNKKKIYFTKYSMTITNSDKNEQKIIFYPDMIYLIIFIYRENIDSKWKFYCFSTIDKNGSFLVYDNLLLDKKGKKFGIGRIDKNILKDKNKIVDFIRKNWINTDFIEIQDIYFTTTPEACILSGVATRV